MVSTPILTVTRMVMRRPAQIAAVLALAVVVTGVTWNTRVAAGADAYGYVSQADLWLRGDLHIDQSFVAAVPWPLARWTFTPLGYRPEPVGLRIVPVYAPGLPMLMAAAKALIGQCGLFLIVPLSGGVLVFATYLIGARIGRPLVGVAASALVATSPAMLFMMMAPMSDVPAAAAWAVAVASVLLDTMAGAALAGVASALAILIRPNLAPLAALLAAWLVWRHGVRPRALVFTLCASIGAASVAVVNARLYGSPLASGYVDFSTAFSFSYVLTNLNHYLTWLASAETVFALAGLACLAVPAPLVWRTRQSRDARILLALFAAVVWVSYLLYVPYDAWWYLRFLLPSWPMMAIGTASLLASAWHRRPGLGRPVAALALVAICAAHLVQANRRDTFNVARGEAKYVEVARVVESLTSPDAVVISAVHSGSLRYYAGRLTLRWDYVDPSWLDRVVEWLAAHGHHPYLLLEEAEIGELRTKHGRVSAVGRLDWQPLVSFRGGAVRFYDAAERSRTTPAVEQTPSGAVRACVPQRPFPRLR